MSEPIYSNRQKRKQRAESRRAEEERLNAFLNTFRAPDSSPLLPGEWACPICGAVGRQSRRDTHIEQEHPDTAWRVRIIESEMKPRAIRLVILPGGSPGGGKRR